jgi:hypothetical protein
MNTRRTILLIIVGFMLACGLALLFGPKNSKQPQVRLRIVRRLTEQGRPVVFFRLDGDANLRILIHGVEKVGGDSLEGRYDSPVGSKDVWGPLMQEFGSAGQDNFWAPSHQLSQWPMVGRNFGVRALTDVPIWKLRVTATMSVPSHLGALEAMPTMWSFCRSHGRTLSQIAGIAWHMGYSGYTGIFETNVIESDFITNGVASAAEVTK